MDDLSRDLVERLLEHCALVCEAGDEGPIAAAVQQRYEERGEPVQRVRNSVVVGAPTGTRPLVLLVGHLDVVAPTDADRDARLEQRDGVDVVVGRGTADMKGGNVVAMRLFEEHAHRPDRHVDLALLLYAGEEGPAEGNELADVLDAVPWLTEAALAVVLEPTDGRVELGCLGGLHARLTVTGRQAHSARPWDGDNAIAKAALLMAALTAVPIRERVVDGIAYRDVWSLTQVWTDNGRNVIPGQVYLNLNFRFSPDRDLADAENEFRVFVQEIAPESVGEVEVEIVDRSPPAPPHASHPAVAAFIQAVGAPVGGKQAWTDVARLAERGVAALNFGPGMTSQAHQRGEYVAVQDVVAAYGAIDRYLRVSADA